LIPDLDPAPLDRFDFGEGDHVGLMDSADNAGGNEFFKLTEILKGHDLLIDRVDPAVVAHAFDVDDFVEHDLFQAIFGLDEDKLRNGVCGTTVDIVPGLVDGLQEAVEGEWLQEVIGDLKFIALEGIFLIGCGEDDLAVDLRAFEEFDASEFIHIDIQEEDIDLVVVEIGEAGEGVVEGLTQMQKGDLVDKVLCFFERQWLVFYDDAA